MTAVDVAEFHVSAIAEKYIKAGVFAAVGRPRTRLRDRSLHIVHQGDERWQLGKNLKISCHKQHR